MAEPSRDPLWWHRLWSGKIHFNSVDIHDKRPFKKISDTFIFTKLVCNNLLDKSITWVLEVYLRISHFHIQNAKLSTEQHRLTSVNTFLIFSNENWGLRRLPRKNEDLTLDSQHQHQKQVWWQTSVILMLGCTGCKILNFMFNERHASNNKVKHDWERCLKSVLTSDSPNGGYALKHTHTLMHMLMETLTKDLNTLVSGILLS